ncbi:hypothetical protein [Pedobacter sp. SYSU D00535]|uniref:hypothetical protein n=1 Tax=Pedobacter sp. SYSU D00535 TaxID=2810308 RepID=UPI001A97AB98|nr:hypothetical protein [Pedobacter sp. SYSU D00535]
MGLFRLLNSAARALGLRSFSKESPDATTANRGVDSETSALTEQAQVTMSETGSSSTDSSPTAGKVVTADDFPQKIVAYSSYTGPVYGSMW